MSAKSAGKGDIERPRYITDQQWDENYHRTFSKYKQQGKCPVCGVSLDELQDEPCDRIDCPFNKEYGRW